MTSVATCGSCKVLMYLETKYPGELLVKFLPTFMSDTQVFQESPGVLLTPQLVLPPQDCCAFRLMP